MYFHDPTFARGLINFDKNKQPFIHESRLSEFEQFILKSGDLVITLTDLSDTGNYLGTIAKIPDNIIALLNQRVAKIIHSKEIHSDYLYFTLQSPHFRFYMKGDTTGTLQKNTNYKYIGNFDFPLPPLNEQKRIVNKIENLQDKRAKVKAELEAIARLIPQFRQSVLAAAFRGDLTDNWRKNNPDVESAELLLEKIKIERRQKWEANELEKMKAQGKTPVNDHWKKKYQEPETVIDVDDLPDIPDSWCWIYLDDICEKITDGEHLTPPTTEKGIYLLSAKDVRDGYLDFSDTKFISIETAEKSRNRCNPEKDDILVVSRGATVGRSCLINTNEIFCLMGSVLLFKMYNKKLINPKIVDYFFKSPFGVKNLISMSGASAQQAIYIKDMRKFIVVIPPLEEQKEIVRRIEKAFKFADRIEREIKTVLEQLENLNQSILAKAFRGELVPQISTDEPASMLLAKIKQMQGKLNLKRAAVK